MGEDRTINHTRTTIRLRRGAAAGQARHSPLLSAALAALIAVLCADNARAWPSREEALAARLKTGKAALEDELYELAAKQLEAYVRKVRKDPERLAEGTVLLARALHGQKKPDAMIQLLRNVPAEAHKSGSGGGLAFWLATAYYETRRYTQALETLASFETRFPDDACLLQAQRLRIRCLLDTDRLPEALEAFKRFDAEQAGSAQAAANLLDWGQVLLGAGRSDEAKTVFRKLVGITPTPAEAREARFWLGQILITHKSYEEARAVLNPLIEQPAPDYDRQARAHYALAQIDEAQGKHADAVAAMRKGLELARTRAVRNEGQVVLGRLLVKTGQIEEGAAMLRAYIAAVPDDPLAERIQLELAEYFLNTDRYDQAVKEYQLYLETYARDDGRAQALYGKGWALLNLGREAEASAAFEKAYSLFPARSEQREKALLKVGDAYFANAQYKTAFATYTRFLTQFPESALRAQAEFQLAESRARDKQIKEAKAAFLALAAQHETDSLAEHALVRVAELGEQQGDLQQALSAYERVMSDYPQGAFFPYCLCSRGILRYRLGDIAGALQDFEEVSARFPETEYAEQAEWRRGACYRALHNDAKALETWRAFVTKRPDSAWVAHVLFSMGEYEYNRQAFKEAESHFSELTRKHPDSPLADDALFWAGRAAFDQAEYRRAAEGWFAALAKKHPTSPMLTEARLLQGDALRELAEYSGAILVFNEFIKQFPNSYLIDRVWLRKGDCQFTLGTNDRKRYEEAITSYRVVVDSANAAQELKLQANCKIGRCLEKMDRTDAALRQYLEQVVYKYLALREQGVPLDGAKWFTRAAQYAAGICEARKNWREAVNIYRRIVEADVPASKSAQERINKIRLENWLLFY